MLAFPKQDDRAVEPRTLKKHDFLLPLTEARATP
jgi:hypothetical protein